MTKPMNTEGMTPEEIAELGLLTRREAIRRVTGVLGMTLVGGSALLAACERERAAPRPDSAGASSAGNFTPQEVAFLDEVADTILPTTSTPGAKAAKTGAFMGLMVTDTYDQQQQQVFRDGMRTLDEESKKANGGAGFMQATPQQRLALLERIDREAKEYTDRVQAAKSSKQIADEEKTGDKYLNDQRQENAKTTPDANPAPAITADSPAHYFRMMKELTMLGYFTSEIGMTQAQRYVESPGRYDPCAPYAPGEKAWAPHA
jgi:hypothetical protein